MRGFTVPLIAAVLLLVAAFVAIGVARGQEPLGPKVINRETQGGNMREIVAPEASAAPQQPNIGFIDSPSATCYQPDPSQNNCYISWYYLSVDASPNYMITMTAVLNNFGPVVNTQGFFQTSMYVPYSMLGQGFKVPCGSPGAGGDPAQSNPHRQETVDRKPARHSDRSDRSLRRPRGTAAGRARDHTPARPGKVQTERFRRLLPHSRAIARAGRRVLPARHSLQGHRGARLLRIA